MKNPSPPGIVTSARQYWRDCASRTGPVSATLMLLREFWEFMRDSTPARRRLRFGDADYDWDFRVNTTSGAVGWRDRLLGVFHSAYQPTEPDLFREMLSALQEHARMSLTDFTFIDLGSGKGRTLLMASDYPFRHIMGVEFLPALHQIAEENIHRYRSDSQKCFAIESVCSDATAFAFPPEPLIVYLFNPFAETGLRRALANLIGSLRQHPRSVFVLYLNPQLENVIAECALLKKLGGTHQYSIFGPSD